MLRNLQLRRVRRHYLHASLGSGGQQRGNVRELRVQVCQRRVIRILLQILRDGAGAAVEQLRVHADRLERLLRQGGRDNLPALAATLAAAAFPTALATTLAAAAFPTALATTLTTTLASATVATTVTTTLAAAALAAALPSR